jgi:signal peptidase I
MSLLVHQIYISLPLRILKASLFVLIAGVFLGAGCAEQGRSARGAFYLLSSILLFGIFVATRWLSSPNGMLVFFGLLLSLYLIYWLDVIRWFKASRGVEQVKQFYIGTILSVCFLFFIISNCAALTGYRIYHIPSASMMPTLIPGDYVLVDQWTYHNSSPQKDDVIVFQHPYHERHYIKRVAYLPNETFMGKSLPENNYAVIGDNIDRSEDSRFFGSIDSERIIGRACYIVFSLNAQPRFNTGRFLNNVALLPAK